MVRCVHYRVDRKAVHYVLHVPWTPKFCSQNGVPITHIFTLNTEKPAAWTQDSLTTHRHFCPPLPLYAKWQKLKRAFCGTAAFNLAATISSCIKGQIPTSSPQHSTSGPLMAKLWTLQDGAYGKCIIFSVRKLEEKSLFGRNTHYPHILNHRAQCKYCQTENSTILHSAS